MSEGENVLSNWLLLCSAQCRQESRALTLKCRTLIDRAGWNDQPSLGVDRMCRCLRYAEKARRYLGMRFENFSSYPDWVEAVELQFFHRLCRQQWAELREVNGCCYGDCSKDISAATTGRANHKLSLDFTHKETLNYEGTGMGRYKSGFHLSYQPEAIYNCFRFVVVLCDLTTEKWYIIVQ